jgi:hypothetical protein
LAHATVAKKLTPGQHRLIVACSKGFGVVANFGQKFRRNSATNRRSQIADVQGNMYSVAIRKPIDQLRAA